MELQVSKNLKDTFTCVLKQDCESYNLKKGQSIELICNKFRIGEGYQFYSIFSQPQYHMSRKTPEEIFEILDIEIKNNSEDEDKVY